MALSNVEMYDDSNESLQKIEFTLRNKEELEKQAAKRIYDYKRSLAQQEVDDEISLRVAAGRKMVALGMAATDEEREARLAAAQKNHQNEIKAAKKAAGDKLKLELEEIEKKKAADPDYDATEAIKAAKARHKVALKNINSEADAKWKKTKESLDKQTAAEKKKQKTLEGYERAKVDAKKLENDVFNLNNGASLKERVNSLKSVFKDEDGNVDVGRGLSAVTKALANLIQQLGAEIDTIGLHKGPIDTRLQGSKNPRKFGIQGLSYWDFMSWRITGIAGVSPFVKQEDLVSQLEDYVKKGISYNVMQRAFLQTISDKIANTFNAADGTLLRLIRIQQQDSTAGRLGMESALNAFLNNMYETSEYLGSIAEGVRGSLEEAQALMGAAQATELEWQVQKWLGSLYSVGMSQKGVQGIADAIGQLAAGQIEGIANGGSGNLIVMAANRAGISIADTLATGLDSKKTNNLLGAVVDYLAEIYNNTEDNRVVQQQLANVFNLTASDIKAVSNLSSNTKIVGSKNLSYADMFSRMQGMANSMYARTSMGEMMTNVWQNFKYTLAAGIANSPALYALYKAAGLLEGFGGIPIPMISILGNTVDLHTSIADLMRIVALSGSILSGIGSMIGGLAAGGGLIPGGMLYTLGITSNLSQVKRGSGDVIKSTGGLTLSESGSLVGNSDSSSIKDKTLQDANEDSANKLEAAGEGEDEDIERKVINNSVLQIYDLLLDVIDGRKAFTTKSGLNGGFN